MKNFAMAVVLALCAVTPTAAAPTVADPQSASAGILAEFMQAWSAADAQALAGLFSDDGDLITPDGIVSRGRGEISAFYAAAFARGYKGSAGTGAVEHVRKIAPDLILVDATWSIEGAHKLDGSLRPPEHGVLVGFMGLRHGKWQILAMRESASAAAFTPLAAAGR